MLPDFAPVTVILLNFNGSELLNRCVCSMREQVLLPARVLFVDNGSDNFDEAAVRFAFGSRYQGVLQFSRLEKNAGYAKGMNHGLERVLADVEAPPWAMTLSNDTELDAEFFQNLDLVLERQANRASKNENIGMFAPKLLSMVDRRMLDGAGIGVSLDGMSTARGQRELDEGQYDLDTHLLIPNGVAALYSVSMLREVGLLDESFWSYCEDTDLGLRAWLAGYDCRFLPECLVYHQRSGTLGEHSLKKLYLVERNHYWVAIKNLPLPLLMLNPTLSTYRYLVQAYALLSGQGQGRGFGEKHSVFDVTRATLRGVLHAGQGAPAVFLKRLRQRKLRRRTTLETLYTLWRKRLPFRDLILK